MTNAGKVWTREEEKKLLALLETNCSLPEIADALQRSAAAVLTHMENMMYTKQKFEQARRVLLNV